MNLYVPSMNLYCVYPAMLNSPKQLPNCLKKTYIMLDKRKCYVIFCLLTNQMCTFRIY